MVIVNPSQKKQQNLQDEAIVQLSLLSDIYIDQSIESIETQTETKVAFYLLNKCESPPIDIDSQRLYQGIPLKIDLMKDIHR